MMLVKIGEGMVSNAYLDDGNRVLLEGKREDSFASYTRLKRNLDLLDGKIKSISIPQNAVLFEPNVEYPYGAFSFDYVKGLELKEKYLTCSKEDKEEIGKGLAIFVSEMQKINFVGDKEEEIKINLNKFNKSLSFLDKYLTEEEMGKLKIISKKYEQFMINSEFCLTHGDLQEENILLDDNNKLCGIIDFGNMEYYVKEIEFVSMMEYDDVIYNSMVNNYVGELSKKNVELICLVKQVRFFKHVIHWSEKAILKEVDNIKYLISHF